MKNKTDMTKIDSTNWKSLMRCLYSDDSSTECLSLKAKNNSYQKESSNQRIYRFLLQKSGQASACDKYVLFEKHFNVYTRV